MQDSRESADNRAEDVMDEHLAQLRAQILRGEYQVDPTAVADAILEHLGHSSECSYPESDRSASVKNTPGSPATTRPTQVSPARLAHWSAAA